MCGVTGRDLVNTASDSRHPGDYLGLEPEPVLFDPDFKDDLAAEHFVACFHVGATQVGEDVRQGHDRGGQFSGLDEALPETEADDRNVGGGDDPRQYG